MREQERELRHWGNASFDSVEDGDDPGLVYERYHQPISQRDASTRAGGET